MKLLSTLLIFSVVGAFGRRADIDINRIKQIPNQVSTYPYPGQTQDKNDRLIIRSNDYDDHSGWYQHPRAPLPPYRPKETSNPKTPVQIHQPREDPRLYYQSDAYLKELGEKNVNQEVTFVYPGGLVVPAGENQAGTYSRIRSNEVETFSASPEDFKMCVKCPHDRTLVAKASLGRVVLQNPILRTCSARKAPRSVRFVHMYGPKIGSLLEQGSHMVIGQIINKNKNLQLCKMQVHVVSQGCATPKYLAAHCWDQNRQCNFTCTNKQFELSGPSTQVCGEDMRWKGDLPVCKVRTWCELPPATDHGRVSCQGAAVSTGLAEGSRCRVKCARGYRALRATQVCRRGAWTHALVCKPVHRHDNQVVQ